VKFFLVHSLHLKYKSIGKFEEDLRRSFPNEGKKYMIYLFSINNEDKYRRMITDLEIEK